MPQPKAWVHGGARSCRRWVLVDDYGHGYSASLNRWM